MEAEDNGGCGGKFFGKDIEFVASFWETGIALTECLRKELKGFAESTHLMQVDLCPFHFVRLKSPSPSSTTLTPQSVHLTILESKAATWESFTRSSLRFAAATRLLGLEVEIDQVGKLKNKRQDIHSRRASDLMLDPVAGTIGSVAEVNPTLALAAGNTIFLDRFDLVIGFQKFFPFLFRRSSCGRRSKRWPLCGKRFRLHSILQSLFRV